MTIHFGTKRCYFYIFLMIFLQFNLELLKINLFLLLFFYNSIWNKCKKHRIDAFYINTKGIIDQLVSIYICMNIEYLSKKKRPVVDAHFINYVADKYYPQMKELLQDIDRPSNQKRITEVLQQGQRRLDIIREEAEQKIVADSIMKQSENIEEEKLLKNVIRNILKVTRAYSADKIHNAFEKLMNQEHSNDENDVTQKVYTMLESTAKKSTSKKTPILSHEAMRKELLEK